MVGSLTSYILPKEDIERVREAGGPLASIPDLSHVREHMAVAVVEVEGKIVAYWPVFYVVHAEPLEIHPDYRKHPGVARALIETMLGQARSSGEAAVFSVVQDPEIGEMAKRLGFQEYSGALFFKLLGPTSSEEI